MWRIWLCDELELHTSSIQTDGQCMKLVLISTSQSNSKCVRRQIAWGGLTSGMDQLRCLRAGRQVSPDNAVVREDIGIDYWGGLATSGLNGCRAWTHSKRTCKVVKSMESIVRWTEAGLESQ